MENLNLLVPQLLDKLKVVEHKKPVNNVTTNIMRIRELIAQARSVAKKVSSQLLQRFVKFKGQGYMLMANQLNFLHHQFKTFYPGLRTKETKSEVMSN